MNSEELLARINYLSKKSKTTALSKKEKAEQKDLRQQYLKEFKKSFTEQITSVKVLDPEGNDVTPEKVKNLRKPK